MRRITILCITAMLAAFNGFAGNVEIKADGKILTVKNQCYQAAFNGGKGYAMDGLNIQGRQLKTLGCLKFSSDGEQPQYIKRYAADPRPFIQSDSAVQCNIIKQGPDKAEFRLDWSFPGGTASDTITCTADSPLIQHEVSLSFNQIMFEANFRLDAWNFSSPNGEGVFFPDKRRVAGVWDTGLFAPCPGYEYAWNPVTNVGVGLIGPQDQDFVSIHYYMRGLKEGSDSDITCMQLLHKPLRYVKLPGQVKFKFFVIAGGNPAEAAKLASAELPAPKEITVDEAWPRKLVTRPGQDNRSTVKVTNHTLSAQKVKLVSSTAWSIDRIETVDSRELELAPGETRQYQFKWNAGKRNYGVTFRTDAYVNDRLIDGREEYCAVSDFAPAAAGVSIVTPGNCNKEGSEAAWMEFMRRGYIGVIEYYCWTPNTIDGLAPQEDKWEPHTESQMSYRVTLTKKFLKTFVNDAHENGISIYAWVTGLCNFRKGLEDPKLFQYCANGQPSIWNSKMYNDTRFAVGSVNGYQEDFARKWGQEMARSVEMFGWDGCRWDWNFIVGVPPDPLYSKNQIIWHDAEGKTSDKLYPDSDETATKALTAWRRAVNEKFPDFVYSTNCFADAATLEKYPKHFAASATKSMMLFEYLLDYSQPANSTWQKWAKNLTEDCQRVRPFGAQPVVGMMRGLLPGTVSRNLAQYICLASGVKWWEGTALPDGLDQNYKSYRFMTRFSEYYFDDAFRLVPEARRLKEIQVSGSPRIFWQQFVYERPVTNGREVTVHLINLPESDYICQRHEVPPVRKNVTVSVMPFQSFSSNRVEPVAEEKLNEAWAMLPNPRPHVLKLQIKDNAVALPELEDAAIILFKFNK